MNTGKPARGREAFETALRLDEHLSSAALNLARFAYTEKKYAESESLLNKALAGDPRNAEALVLLANVQLTMGKPAEAVASARKVHSIPHEKFAVAHYIAGRALEAMHQASEAAVEYKLY